MASGEQPSGDEGGGFDPVAILSARFAEAIRRAVPDLEGEPEPLITPSKQPKLGDFQSNAAMGLAKRVGEKPRDLAARIVDAVDVSGIAEPLSEDSIAGPGFINIRLRGEALADILGRLDTPALGLTPPADPETVVVDLCGVNLAKEMHVGHLRSTIIGDAIAQAFERLGHRVIRQNHVGDWGLQIAMVVWKLSQQTDAEGKPQALDLADVERLYRDAQRECDADHSGLAAARKWGHPKAVAELEAQVSGAEAAMAEAKQWLIRLQQGDEHAEALWRYVRDVTKAACLENCRRLRTQIDEKSWAGESSYRLELAPLIEDLQSRAVAEEDRGALVVKLDDRGIREPCLVRKSDGGYLYATTDLAAIRRRVQEFGADEVIYCVDARQGLHFKQVFEAAKKAGYAEKRGGQARLAHAAFGTILGEDGKPFKTRSGENVKLSNLLDEAEERALRVVREKNTDLPADEAREVAEAVAIAAIKYADLSNERIKDYVFSFDRMLAFEGNTGPYLLYALVRLRSIFRRAEEAGVDTGREISASPLAIGEPEEKQLALALLRYPQSVRAVTESLEPHRLCAYLYDLATAFSAFFDRCHVIKADPEIRGSRLRMCDLTRRVLANGLGVLGLPTVERM